MTEAFIIGWNVQDTIKFTIDHYKSFCDRVTFFDNFSDDNTREIALECGADVRLFGTKGVLSDQDYVDIKNNCWKKSEADWVIIVDDDEILKEVPKTGTIAQTQGFDIYSYEMPKKSFLELSEGVKNDSYSKVVVFNPKKIKAINYVYGCHVADPQGEVIWAEETPLLLHYRSIGGPERLIRRQRSYLPRLSDLNKRWKLGIHYSQDEGQKIKEWIESYSRRVKGF